MMYGFGDDFQPYAESVELLEDLVVQYITDMVEKKKKENKNIFYSNKYAAFFVARH